MPLRAAPAGAGRPRLTKRTPRPGDATSWASTPAVRVRMQRQPTRDTAAELALRRLLHATGLRYRVDAAPLPGLRRRADIVFRPARVAIFVDGCFWHGCPDHGRRPTISNPGYWSRKVKRNQARDHDTDERLAAAGWVTLRVWEHEAPAETAARIAATVRSRRIGLGHGTQRHPACDTPRAP